MNQFTRREAIRRGVLPLVAVTGTGGLVAAIARAGTADSDAEVAFATVLTASDSSLTVARDDASELTIPITQTGSPAAPPWRGNPFRVGDRVVLDLDPQGAVVGVEPLSDFVSGVLDRQDGNRLSVGGTAFVVDDWSLARIGTGADGGTVVPLAGLALAPRTEVSLLARRRPGHGARRIAALFANATSTAGVGG